MQREIFIITAFFIFSGNLFGQSLNTITGIIQDKTSKQPIEFATVQLLQLPDSTVLKTTVTDKKGKFTIEDVQSGNYIVSYTFIGYSQTILSVTVDQKKENLGQIELETLSTSLAEVTVTGRKSLLSTSIDRKVYNVSQDIMAQSGVASDILKNIPSVEVDIDGTVNLRGSSDVMILINGRPSPLMGRSRAEVLQQLPANSIERIEVITNPSARFKPDGTSGIINIVLKKNTKQGWSGAAILNAGNNDRYSGNLTFNYKPGKLNFFGNYSLRQDSRLRTNTIDREYLDASGIKESFYYDKNSSLARPVSHFATLGIDYTIDDKNTIGLSGNYHYRDQVKNDVQNRLYTDKNKITTSQFDRLRYDPEFEKEKDATAYWQHNFAKEDKELRIELNVSTSDEVEDNHYSTIYYYPIKPSAFDNTLIKQGDKQQQFSIDFTNPITEDSKIETGYLGSFSQIDLDFYGELYDTTQKKFIKDNIRSNRFTYNESIHAFYGTYQRQFEKFGYSAGLRAEQAIIKGNLVTKDSLISNDYFKMYPTLHLAYKLKNGELQLNYSKRVNRPDGDEMNPFPEYKDPLNLRAGNPKLLPEMIHSVEFGYKWQNDNFSLVPSLYYRYKKNGFTSVTIPLNDSVLLTTEQNLSNDQSAGLEIIFSAKAGKFFSSNLSTNFFYNQIDASDLGFIGKKTIFSMSTNFNATFTITKTTVAQISSNFRSARLTPQGKSYASFVFNAGVRQDLFKKKASITLTASDIFKTLRYKNEFNTTGLQQVSFGRRDAQIIYLGFSYRFGKTPKKSKEVKLEFDNSL
ncbi:MAG: TonB-dependent receptor [Chitinophagaceae bacterium]